MWVRAPDKETGRRRGGLRARKQTKDCRILLSHVIARFPNPPRVLNLCFGNKWNVSSSACQDNLSGDPPKTQVVQRTARLREGVLGGCQGHGHGQKKGQNCWLFHKIYLKIVHFLFLPLTCFSPQPNFKLWQWQFWWTLKKTIFPELNLKLRRHLSGKITLDSGSICTTLNQQLHWDALRCWWPNLSLSLLCLSPFSMYYSGCFATVCTGEKMWVRGHIMVIFHLLFIRKHYFRQTRPKKMTGESRKHLLRRACNSQYFWECAPAAVAVVHNKGTRSEASLPSRNQNRKAIGGWKSSLHLHATRFKFSGYTYSTHQTLNLSQASITAPEKVRMN